MPFWLKKLISFWLMPLPACLALLVIASLALLAGKGRRLSRALVVIATALLLLLGNKTVSTALIRPLEWRYAPVPDLRPDLPSSLAACHWVVVLGAGDSAIPGLSATNQLSFSALERLVEAVRILRVLPEARLLVSGPGRPGRPTHASVLFAAARELGVAPGRIQMIDWARDTEQEAQAVRSIAGRGPVALVTSAWHMPRAAGLFRHQGVEFFPCPTDYQGRSDPGWDFSDLGWDVDSLDRSTHAVHEYLGILWERIRGQG